MRRESIRVARDMAYKRTAMSELAREHPMLLSATNFTASTARSSSIGLVAEGLLSRQGGHSSRYWCSQDSVFARIEARALR